MTDAFLHACQLQAVRAAQIAGLNLTGLLVAHGLPRQKLPLLLETPQMIRYAVDVEYQAILAVAAAGARSRW